MPKNGACFWALIFARRGPKNVPVFGPHFSGPQFGWALNLECNAHQCCWAFSVTLPAFHPCSDLVILNADSLQRSAANMWQCGPVSCVNSSNNGLQLATVEARSAGPFRVAFLGSEMGPGKASPCTPTSVIDFA